MESIQHYPVWRRISPAPTCLKHHRKDIGDEDLRALIANEAPHLLGARGLRNFGLSRACEVFLGKRLDKAEQCSDWSARPLSREQLEYGALDAFVCAAIAAKISKEKGKAALKYTES